MNLESKIRVPELDLLRFIAALSVVIYHFTFRRFPEGSEVPLFALFEPWTKYGYLGVNLFFIISGFVIAWSSATGSPLDFINSRISRLYPTYWFAVAFTSLFVFVIGSYPSLKWSQLLVNLTMIPGLLGIERIDEVYWTLQIELKFYFIVFLLMLFKQIKRSELWILIWLMSCFYCYFFPSAKIATSLSIYPYASYFIAGAIAFLIRSKGLTWYRLMGFIASLTLSLANAPEQSKGFIMYGEGSIPIVMSLIIFLYLTVFTVSVRAFTLPSKDYIAFLGALTYPLYLLHNRIGKELFSWFMSLHLDKNFCLFLVLVTLFLLVCVVVKWVDQPASRWMKRYLSKYFSKWTQKQALSKSSSLT